MRKFFIFFILFLSIIILLAFSANNYLIVNKPVKSNDLIIEGWLPQYSIETFFNNSNISKYERIYITGIAGIQDTSYINNRKIKYEKRVKKIVSSKKLITNGTIYLTNFALNKLTKKEQFKTIVVYAYGDTALNKSAHYFVSISDSIIGETFSKTYNSPFIIKGNFYNTKLRFFNIFYDNDLSLSESDRNLIVDSVAFDNIVLKNKADFYSISENTLPNGKRNFPFHSNALYTKAYIKALGFKGKIITIDTLYTDRNKTWATAKQFAKFHKLEYSNGESINVLSFNYHSRRSYLTYKHVLPNANIGIICLKDIDSSDNLDMEYQGKRLFNIIDEYLKIIGNNFYN